MITIFLIILTSLLVGYYLGSQRSFTQDTAHIKKELLKRIEKDDIGGIKRPSAEKIYEINHPHIAQEKQAMRETLEKEVK